MDSNDYDISELEVPEERASVSRFFGYAEHLLGFSIPWFDVSLLCLILAGFVSM